MSPGGGGGGRPWQGAGYAGRCRPGVIVGINDFRCESSCHTHELRELRNTSFGNVYSFFYSILSGAFTSPTLPISLGRPRRRLPWMATLALDDYSRVLETAWVSALQISGIRKKRRNGELGRGRSRIQTEPIVAINLNRPVPPQACPGSAAFRMSPRLGPIGSLLQPLAVRVGVLDRILSPRVRPYPSRDRSQGLRCGLCGILGPLTVAPACPPLPSESRTNGCPGPGTTRTTARLAQTQSRAATTARGAAAAAPMG